MVGVANNVIAQTWTQKTSRKPEGKVENSSLECARKMDVVKVENVGRNGALLTPIIHSSKSDGKTGGAKPPKLLIKFARALRAVFSFGKGGGRKGQELALKGNGTIKTGVKQSYMQNNSIDGSVITSSECVIAELSGKLNTH